MRPENWHSRGLDLEQLWLGLLCACVESPGNLGFVVSSPGLLVYKVQWSTLHGSNTDGRCGLTAYMPGPFEARYTQ